MLNWMFANFKIRPWLGLCVLMICLSSFPLSAAPLLISITNAPASVIATAVGDTQFWPNAGTTGGTPISLRATVTSISAGDTISLFTSGDNPVVRANTGTLAATILWEVFDTATGLPISGDPDFLITDIDGSNGNPIESVSAACAGLTSYTVNGDFIAGCNANTDPNPPDACQTNIQVSESGGEILAEGSQNQGGTQQEGYMQFSWTNVSSWTVSYFATTSGRWYVHDADGDVPFDATETLINLVDMATIKGVTSGSLTSPAQGEFITFQIDMSNLGPEIATNANLTDLLPAGLAYDSHTVTAGNYDPITGLWSGVTVAVNGIQTLTITAEVTATAGTSITNISTTALADESICSSRDLLEYPFIVAETPAPELEIIKTVDPITSFSAAGDTITYSYLVSNVGNVNIDNVVPTDSGPTFNSLAATGIFTGFTPASATITPGNSQTYTATYVLTQVDVDNVASAVDPLTAIDNSASATGTPPAGSVLPVVPDSMVETGFDPMPSLTVAKSVSTVTPYDKAGDTITYEYIVENTGNITIADVVPTDSGPTFNGAVGTGVFTGFSPALVDLAPSDLPQTYTATYVLTQMDVDNMAGAVDPLTAIDNIASATGDPVGATALPIVLDSMAETGFAAAPSLTVLKTVSAATTFDKAGDIITYQYVIENTGNVTLNAVVPTDSGPTFNALPATNSLSAFSPLSANIAPGDPPVTFTATYILDQADIDNMSLAADPSTAIDNTASATATPVGGALASVLDSSAETGFALTPVLDIVKTAGMPTIGLGSNAAATDGGDTIAYSFEVTNSGDVTIDSLVINDAGPTFNGAMATGNLSGITCAVTILAPLQSTTCNATYTLSQADVDNAIIGGVDAVENSATVSGDTPNDDVYTSPAADAEQTIAADASIEITKSASAPTIVNGPDATIVDPGDTISYQINVENTGNTTLSNVLVSDSITTLTCPATTVLGNAFVNDGSDTLAVADSIVCTATYTLMQTNLDNGGVQNIASVTSADPNGDPVNGSDTVDSGFTQKASLSLIKSASSLPDPANVGDVITYSFEVTNTGNVTLTGAQVSDPICQTPASPLTFASGYVSGDAGVAGAFEAGEVWIYECGYALALPDINAGEIANTAEATGTPPVGSGLADPTSTASNLVDAGQNAAIALDKSSSLPSVAGGSITSLSDVGDTVDYTFVIENTGNVTLTSVTLTDPLITSAPNNGSFNCSPVLATMLPAAVVTCTGTYTLTQDDINAGMVGNTANVMGNPPPSVPPADSPEADSSNVVTIAPAPSLTVVKSASAIASPLLDGDMITYTYLIENTGNVTIASVSPVDSGPTFNGTAGTNSLSVFSPVTATIEPGLAETFSATYIVTQEDIDNMAAAADPLTAIDNTATATGMPENGSLSPVIPSTVETGSAPSPSVELVKTSLAPNPALVGTDITYTFVLSNTGNVSISNPIVTDSLCASPGSVLSFTSGYVSGDTGVTVGALDVGEAWTYQCTYAIDQNDIDAGTVQNTAIGSGQDPAGGAVEDDSDSGNPADTDPNDDDPTNTPLVQTPSWIVTKSTTSAPSIAGDTLVYEFVLTNNGNVSISSINLVDAKCAAAPVVVSGDTGGDSVLSPNEVWNLQCTSIGVTQTEVNDGMVDNEVDAIGSVPPGSPALPIAEADESTPIVPMPALTLDKTVSPPTVGFGAITTATDVGDTISYSFEVTNSGNVTVDSIVINDSGPTFDSNANTAVNWSGVSCVLTSLIPLQSTTCNATYILTQDDINNAIAGGALSVENSATAEGQDPDNNAIFSPSATASETIEAESLIEILKTASAPTTGAGSDPVLTDPDGDTIAFQFAVENTGNTTLTNVVVSDPLVTNAPNNGTIMCSPVNPAVLLPGAVMTCNASYSITQADIDAGQVINAASVSAQDPTGDDVIGISEVTSPFTQKTSIALTKTASVLPIAPPPVEGDLITYTFDLENTGNVTLSAPMVSDPQCQIPAGPLTATNGLNSLTDVGSDGVLDAGEIWTFSCDYELTQTDIDGGEITNTATGSGTPPVDSGLDAPSSTSSALVKAEQSAAITLDKVAGVPTIADGSLATGSDVGDSITFTFNIANTGNITFDTVTLDDPLITGAPNSAVLSCVLDSTSAVFTLGLDSLSPAQGNVTCLGEYQLTQEDIDSGSVANVATVLGDPPGAVPPPPEATSGSMVPITPVPTLTVVKSASAIPSAVVAGTVITYSYAVENTGNVTIDNVSPIDLGPTFNGVAGTNALGAYTPISETLAPGDDQIFTADYVLSQDDLDNMAAAADPVAAISNEASVTGEPANGPLEPVEPSTVDTGVAPEPALELIKTSSVSGTVAAGSLITYTFMLENTGNVTISNPVVEDAKCEVPSGTLSFTNGYVAGDTGTIAQALDVDETWEFSCDYAITQADLDAGTVQNTALATGQDPAGNDVEDNSDSGNPADTGANDDDPTNTPLVQNPDWEIVKSTLSVPTGVGDTLVYTFALTNTGNVSIDAVTVSDGKCVGDVATLDSATDLLSDGILSPEGAAGVPAAETWTYSCTSIPVTQTEMDNGAVLNDVIADGSTDGGGLADAIADISTTVTQTPLMSLVKSAGLATLNADGSFDQVFNFALENTGNVTLSNISIVDNIGTQFGTCFDSVLQTGVATLTDVIPTADSTAPALGATPILATTTTLAVGDRIDLTGYSVRFNPNALGCAFPIPATNTATANAGSPAGPIIDVSDNGTDPSTGGSNDAGDPTPFTPPAYLPDMGVSKAAGVPTLNSDGSFDVQYTMQIANTGNVDIVGLDLFDDLVTQFGSAFTASDEMVTTGGVLIAPAVTEVVDTLPDNLILPTTNDSYDGSTTNMFAATSDTGYLGVGDIVEVTFTVRIDPNVASAPVVFENTATAGGNDPSGGNVTDDSSEGSDPTDESDTPTSVTPPVYAPDLGVAKAAGVPTLNADGSFDVPYTILIQNTGDVIINQLDLFDNLVTQFGSAFTASDAMDASGGVLIAPSATIITDASPANAVSPIVNALYDGAGTNMFDGLSGVLGVDDVLEVTFSIRINPNAAGAISPFENTATAGGDDPSGDGITDDSSDGSDPTDETDTATPVTPPLAMPDLGVAKAAGVPSLNADGSFDVEYTMLIANTGNVVIDNLSLMDDLNGQFGSAFTVSDATDGSGGIVIAPSVSLLTDALPLNAVLPIANTGFDGGATNALDGVSGFLGVGDIIQVTFTARVNPNAAGAASPFVNTATASGMAPNGGIIVDDSSNGSDPTDESDMPTSIQAPVSTPSIGVAKELQAGSPVDLGDGTYQLTYDFIIENNGDVNLTDIQLMDDLVAMINNPNANNASVSNAVVTSPNGTLTPSTTYNGMTNINLLSGNDALVVNAVGLLQLTFVFTPDVYFGPFFNQAQASALDPGSNAISDLSQNGPAVSPDMESQTPFAINTPSTPITLGWFKSSQTGDVTLFEWATEVEVSNAGFYLSVLNADGGLQQINPDMIPSQGDSVDVQYYEYAVSGLIGEEFIFTDVSVTGAEVQHGPYQLNQEYGVESERQQTDWQEFKQESDSKQELRDQQRQQELRDRLQKLLQQGASLMPNENVTHQVKQGVKQQPQHEMPVWQRVAALLLSALIAPVEAAELVSFEVAEAGLYSVSHAQLQANGLDLRGVALNRIGLKQNNILWPLKVYPEGSTVFTASSSLMFPGEGISTLYSTTNQYTLVVDEGQSLIADDDSPIPDNTAPAISYLAETSYAPQNHYTHISPSETDSWYADSLKAISGTASKQVTLSVTDAAPALNSSFSSSILRSPVLRPRLEVNLWGNSNLPGNGVTDPDHHILVELNGELVADETFDGLHIETIDTVLSEFNYGDNLVKVTLPKDHGYQFDLVNIDRISLHYPRRFYAQDIGRSLVFESTWNFFKVSELVANTATIVRVDDNGNGYLMTTRGTGTCTQGCVYFSGSDATQVADYYLATNNGLKTPSIKLLSAEQDILSQDANYLIIAHPDFINTPSLALETYASELVGIYGSADIVNVENIYAQYSGHVFDAQAIHDYIIDAVANRNTQHVMLVGGDIYDYLGNLDNDAKSFIPSLYVKIATNVNAVPSDAQYADIDADHIPDITISRLPVRSSAELETLLTKRQQYLTRSYTGKAIFAADKVDGSGYNFKTNTKQAINTYFGDWTVNEIYLDDVSVAAGKQQLISNINSGASLTSYIGHSSTDRWSISGLLTGVDVAGLSNSAAPTVVTQWGCWNTFYVSPEQDSLAHRFLVDSNNGAVTVMGASSFTKADAEVRMADLLFARINQGMRIGDAVLSAKQALAQDYPYQLDVLLGWAVLGPDDMVILGNQ